MYQAYTVEFENGRIGMIVGAMNQYRARLTCVRRFYKEFGYHGRVTCCVKTV